MRNKEVKEMQYICLLKWIRPEIVELIILNTESGTSGGDDGVGGDVLS